MARLRGFVWLAAGLAVAALAGIVAFVTLSTAEPRGVDQPGPSRPAVSVVAAARSVEVRSLLTADDLELRDVPVDAAPETALRKIEDGVGKITMVDLYPGEIILSPRVVAPDIRAADGRTAVLINDDQVLMAFPPGDLMSGLGVLKPGDHVDLLLTMSLPKDALTETGIPLAGAAEAGGESTTFLALQNLVIAQVVRQGEDGGVAAYLLTVSPQDALLLKYIKDAGANRDIVLRAPGVEGEFETYPVDLEYLINSYRTTEEAEP
ncbi:MAG: Flp pilus assembly protein CpaB [Anaerolineae bacterium]|jgi:Flp pilus assembly protein CpaB